MLSSITWNANDLKLPETGELKLYMGVGLLSGSGKLSQGLPLDFLNMMIPAKVIEAGRGLLYN